MRVCLYCQKPLPEKKRADAKYCDVNCRKNSFRLKERHEGGVPPHKEVVFVNPNAKPPKMPKGKTLETMNMEEFLLWLDKFRSVPQKVKEDLYAKWEAGQLTQEPKVTKREKETRAKPITDEKVSYFAIAAARERAKKDAREEPS